MFAISTKAAGSCTAPVDVCLVPAPPAPPVPTPFVNLALCSNAQGTVSAVLVENMEVLVESSKISLSTGDEPGVAGGVISGVNCGPVSFRSSSGKVYAKGKRVVMLSATSAHNGDNPNAPVGLCDVPSQTKVTVGS